MSEQRIFLVGCPRSGTTLLQSLLASHSQIASFPESHFFECLISDKKWLNRWGIASRYARPRLGKFIEEIGRERVTLKPPEFCFLVKQYVKFFVELLDTVTRQQHKSIWLEKTPGHLNYIDAIEKFVPQAKFIHINRNGCDVVASLYEVSNQYPQFWGGETTIDKCIEQWNSAIKISYENLHKPHHILVLYEDLVQNPALVLSKLCEFMEVSFTPAMLKGYAEVSSQVLLNHEPWKQGVKQKIKNNNQTKFERIFDQEQRDYIQKQLLLSQPYIAS